MRNALALALAVMLLATGVMGCTAPPPASMAAAMPAEGDPARTPDPALADAINDFGFDLLRQVDGSSYEARQNVVVSPLSIHAALTMTLNGAEAETAEEMASALHLDSLGLEAANPAYADLLAALGALDSSTDTTLTVANSLWLNIGVDTEPDFAEANRRYFGAQVEQIDLGAPDAADRMNAWVAEQTRGDITELIDEESLDGMRVLYLINALHLDAAWEHPFDESSTRPGTFAVTYYEQVEVPFMHSVGTLAYAEHAGWQAVRLPFSDRRLATWLLLPITEIDTSDYRRWLSYGIKRRLDSSTWRELTGSAEQRRGTLALPRFSSRYHADLTPALSAMGMPDASAGRVDFTGISRRNPDIGRVVHETTMDVTESGIRASAATAVEMLSDSLAEQTFEMTLDRPFLIAIEDEPSGALLFLGAIHDPR